MQEHIFVTADQYTNFPTLFWAVCSWMNNQVSSTPTYSMKVWVRLSSL